MSTPPIPPSGREVDSDSARAENEALKIRDENQLALPVAVRRAARLVLLALVPPASMGIAVGASVVVLKLAAPSLHLAGLIIVWLSTTIISVTAIVAGLFEARDFQRNGRPAANERRDGDRSTD